MFISYLNANRDKPRPYLFGETSFVAAGFIPACMGRILRCGQVSNKSLNSGI
jgi:hypothetical protein